MMFKPLVQLWCLWWDQDLDQFPPVLLQTTDILSSASQSSTLGRAIASQVTASQIQTHTHTPFNGPFSRTTWVSRYQKSKTNLDFSKARDSEWQWHQLGHMQVCTLLQTQPHQHPTTLFFTGRMPFLPPNQQCQSTEGKTSQIQHN